MTSLVEVYRRWPTEADCLAHLERVRWSDKPLCPYCGAERVARHREQGRRDRLQCQRCAKSFSVTVNTIFHNSHVDLQRWFLLISLMLNAKKGLSAMQAARDLGMRRPTVWSMMHRVRAALDTDEGGLLRGVVEMDETFVGGKPRKPNDRDDDQPRSGPSKKTPVIGAVERGGRIRMKVAERSELDGEGLKAFVLANIDCKRTMLTTDEWAGYNGMNRIVAHRTINHSKRYSERDLFAGQYGSTHTNTMEGGWAILKRAIYGQFHRISVKYLPLYLREIAYRYNMRNSEGVFGAVLHLAVKP